MPQNPVDSLSALIATGKAPGDKDNWNGMHVYVVDPAAGRDAKPLVNAGGDVKQPAASLTKMMTFYVTLKTLKAKHIDPNDETVMVPISARARSAEDDNYLGGVKSLPLPVALGAMMTASDNGAAVALSEWVQKTKGGNFLQDMSFATRDLHMDGTTFNNVNGLPRHAEWKKHHVPVSADRPDNMTTAHDMAKMITALNTEFPKESRQFMGKGFIAYGPRQAEHNVPHHLLDRCMPELHLSPGDELIAKTGFTNKAGHNLTVLVTAPDGRQLVAVVLGSHGASKELAREMGVPEDYIPKSDNAYHSGEAMNGTLAARCAGAAVFTAAAG